MKYLSQPSLIYLKMIGFYAKHLNSPYVVDLYKDIYVYNIRSTKRLTIKCDIKVAHSFKFALANGLFQLSKKLNNK